MDGHRGGRHNKAAPRRYGERYADGMAAAEHKRNGRLEHPGEQLRDCKPRLDIAADSVENDDKPFNFRVLLHREKLRDHMLIFGRLVLCG